MNVNDEDITHVPIEKRNIGIVFQSYALFPTMTVYDNIAFGLKLKKNTKDEIDKKVREIARKVDLSDEQLKRRSVSFPAANSSVLLLHAHWLQVPASSAWTSLCPTWMRSFVCSCATS